MKNSLPLTSKQDTCRAVRLQRQGQPDEQRKQAVTALQRVFGYQAFRGEQEAAILAALQGRDSFVLMPTGGGKSLCYTIPALVLQQQLVLVVSPLIALMQDQVASLHSKGIAAAYLSSDVPSPLRKALLSCLENKLSTKGLNLPFRNTGGAQPMDTSTLRMLYVTPELLATQHFRRTISVLVRNDQLGLIAVDEAHCISSWGHDFRPKYRQLVELHKLLGDDDRRIPIMALTATATRKVQDDIVGGLALRQPLVLLSSFNRPNITYSVHLLDVTEQQRKMQAQGPSTSNTSVAAATQMHPTFPQESKKDLLLRHIQAAQAAAGVASSSQGAHGVQQQQPQVGGGQQGPVQPHITAASAKVQASAGAQQLTQPGQLQQQQQPYINTKQDVGQDSGADDIAAGGMPEDLRQLSRLLAKHLGNAGEPARGCAVVYVHRRSDADDVVSQVSRLPQWRGLRCAAYHAGMKDQQRALVMQQWQEKKLDLVAATVAFGMGIDRADVRLVVHWCVPLSVEGYYQESGRAGRDGLPAHAALFYSQADRRRIEWILQQEANRTKGSKHKDKKAKQEGNQTGASHKQQAFEAVLSYATQAACRRATLLAHFGESLPAGSCQGCDYCRNPNAVKAAVSELDLLKATGGFSYVGGGGGGLIGRAANSWAGRRADTDTYGFDQMAGGHEDEDDDEVSGSDSEQEPDKGMQAAAAAAAAARQRAGLVQRSQSGANSKHMLLAGGQQPRAQSGLPAGGVSQAAVQGRGGVGNPVSNVSSSSRAITAGSGLHAGQGVPKAGPAASKAPQDATGNGSKRQAGGKGDDAALGKSYWGIMEEAEKRFEREQSKSGRKGFLASLNKKFG